MAKKDSFSKRYGRFEAKGICQVQLWKSRTAGTVAQILIPLRACVKADLVPEVWMGA